MSRTGQGDNLSGDAVSMEASTVSEEYSKGRMTPQSCPELDKKTGPLNHCYQSL